MPGGSAGTVRFRATRVVDVAIGFDEADSGNVSADRGVYISNDGLRHDDVLLNVGQKKRRLTPGKLQDPLAAWVPVNDADDVLDEDLLHDMDQVSGIGKRKRYESSDDPMAQWRGMKQFFLDESVRRDGLGDAIHSPECGLCKKAVGPLAAETPRFFRCTECGDFLQCEACCLERHQLTPLHFLKEWTGDFWEPRTLESLGLTYQLGHQGLSCPAPVPLKRTMVVLDTNGVHTLRFQYCACLASQQSNNLQQILRNGWYPATVTDPSTCATFNVLDLFRLLNVVGNMNVHDFVGSLERRTDALCASGKNWMPDRYKAFSRMTRQWAFLQRARRAGRAHDPAGVDATKLGELTVVCWACPHDARNLPPDWREVDPKYRFLYMLLVAVDANFKLKNRLRANERYDPSLGPGWGAFVEPTEYKEHLRNYVGENDISTCIAFAALLQKDSRLTTGLRTSGVGGCVCARHECVRPNGLGDLQKGERYANMDFIVMAALAGAAVMMLTISYDIACQWKKNLPERNGKLPERIRLDLENTEVQCGLPVWHASSHETECSNENSLSFLVGVGKSDGEGVERTWADLNPAAFHTKEMGLGNRADTLEDKVDSHNFLKNISQVDALRRKLLVAIAERQRQVDAFNEVNKTVDSAVRKVWQESINAFVVDHTQPNPYVLKTSEGRTEAQIRLDLKLAEEEEARKAGTPLHGTSATAFLVAGIQLENTQRKILADLGERVLVTADRASKIQDRRRAFFSKLQKFWQLQEIFTPSAARAVASEEALRDPDAPPVKAEEVHLYMPSDLSAGEQKNGCQRGVIQIEAKLREGQCDNAMGAIRSGLHTKRHLIGFRNSQITGQVKATKARTLIGQVGERVDAQAAKYRQGRKALENLVKDDGGTYLDHHPEFRELKPSHLTLANEEIESDTTARKKLALLGAGKGSRMPRHVTGSSRQVLSWIWMSQGGASDEEETHASMRVEWCRAKARKVRWEEEVLLLREEMRRVLRYLEWEAESWSARASTRENESPELRHGLAAYALRHAAMYRGLATFFKAEWDLSVGQAASAVVRDLPEDGADLVQLFAVST
ncbi:hypothetical protein B0H13DRAFT_2367453 [Mycena leptocephala]|nr:hypothetical protein B0H13DRAFT_2367453 [Mycena leptocephala]